MVAALLGITSGPDAAPPSLIALRGAELFAGRRPLIGRIAGQDLTLPIDASRCVNCHLDGKTTWGAKRLTNAQTFGPGLNAAYLESPRRRRNGPRVRYDVRTFCIALRTGIDPARVIIARSMPRYRIEDSDCEALWAHLTDRQP